MKIKSLECKFVTHLPAIENEREDIHLVKQYVTLEDGSRVKELRVIKDFKRPFYVTRKHYQKYKDKKECEDLERVNTYYSTQSDLGKECCSRLGGFKYAGRTDLWGAKESPYLYGVEIDSRTILKHMYSHKYPDSFTPYDVAVLDIEINIETEEIVIISIATSKKVYVGILESILKGRTDVVRQLNYLYGKYIPETNISKGITPEFYICKNEKELITKIIGKIHNDQPDFLAIWNMDFDIPHIAKRCEKYNIEMKDIFSDPNLPKEYREFEYKRSMSNRTTASGVSKLYNPWEQWHTVKTSSSFYIIDAMCSYYYVRVGGKQVPGGYSLDNILDYELGSKYKKLKFEYLNTNHTDGIDWHRSMLNDHPLEYVVYNIWDCISILELDNKTKDLSYSLPALSGDSSFDVFKSGPKKITDALHFFYLEKGKVLGLRYADKKNSTNLLGLDGWIQIMKASRIQDNGINYIEEYEGLKSTSRSHIFDLDAVSAYPNSINAANISRETTSKEIVEIEGMVKDDFMNQNINTMFGRVNSIEYCVNMLNFPNFEEVKNRLDII